MNLSSEQLVELADTSLRMRERIIRLACDGGCFLGASLSAVDTINYLYHHFLNIQSFDSFSRDYFFLSKGHDVPALYSVFVDLGWLDESRLKDPPFC